MAFQLDPQKQKLSFFKVRLAIGRAYIFRVQARSGSFRTMVEEFSQGLVELRKKPLLARGT